MKKIMIAVDGGPTSEKVAKMGFELGQKLEAEIALLSIADTTYLITDGAVTPDELAEIVKRDLTKSQQLIIDSVFKNYTVQPFIEKGIPYEAILKVADEWQADLIVLGTHGRTGLAHLLMGSVAEKVMRHSARPLFVVPNNK